MISKILESFRPRPLAPTVTAALAVGEAQARRWGQDYVGVEHLLWGLMETRPPDHPDWSLLQPIGIDWTSVRKTIIDVASHPQDRWQPPVLPCTPRCQLVLKLARKLAREHQEREIDVNRILEAILQEGESVAFYAILCSITIEPTLTASSPVWLRQTLEKHQLAYGRAWEVPRAAAASLRRHFHPELIAWHSQVPDQRTMIRSNLQFNFLSYPMVDLREVVRIFIGPGSEDARKSPVYPRKFKEFANIIQLLATTEIPYRDFYEHFPAPRSGADATIQTEFFNRKVSLPPDTAFRPLRPEDADPCREIYLLMETKHQVPLGFADEFNHWLTHSDAKRFVLDRNGGIVGCCGLTLQQDFDPNVEGAIGLLGCSLSFGFIHPDFQRQGLGLAQLALRLALAQRMGAGYVILHATDISRPFLERAGFQFWRSYLSELGEILHEGSLRLADQDSAVLQPWLELLPDECLEST